MDQSGHTGGQAHRHATPEPPIDPRYDMRAQRTPARGRWVFAGFAVIGLTLVAVEHRAHVLGWLPWLFLLACPLMHFFMHRGHGHGGEGHRDRPAAGDRP